MSSEPPPIFVGWMHTETICGCFWRKCKHKRQDVRRNAALDVLRGQMEALTATDRRWLFGNGWKGPARI